VLAVRSRFSVGLDVLSATNRTNAVSHGLICPADDYSVW
jgi:hypothetical protein